MKKIITLFLPLALLLPEGAAKAAMTLTDESITAPLGRHAEILQDSTGALNIHRVSSPEYLDKFRFSREGIPNLGLSRSPVWVRFKVKNLTFSEAWILQAAYPEMDNVELYSGDASNWDVQESGRSAPFSLRKSIDRNLLFPLSLPFGKERTFYLRYQNGMGMTIPLRLYSFPQYQAHAMKEQLAFGIFFGFMLVLSLYNLILFIKVRESGYAYCFLYITAYGLFQFSLYGLAHQYLWPGSGGRENGNALFLLASAFSCRLLFTMSVLDSKANAPRLHAAMQALLAALALFAGYQGLAVLDLLPLALTLGPGATLWGSALYFSAFASAVFSLTVRCLGKKVPGARTFAIAWIFMMSGLILYVLKCLGLLPSVTLTEYAISFGSVGEMCLLFLSLGESIQAIKSEAQAEHRREQAAIHAYQEAQIRSMRLELELLKANIHPHFMLNSINAAIMWIREDPATAAKLLHALSRELKQLLKIVGEKVIPIGEEIRICRMHLEVMSLRHDKSFTLRLEGIEAGEKFPPMVFHTLVENGLTHGYAGRDAGEFILGRSEDEGEIRFTLFNDGAAGNRDAESNGLGLKYVRARLQEAFGRNWRLDSHAVPGGWLVTITLRKESAPGSRGTSGARPETFAVSGMTA